MRLPPISKLSSGLVEHRRRLAGRAQVADAAVLAHRVDELHRLVGVARIEDDAAEDGAQRGDVFERHLRGAVGADRDADVGAAELQVGVGDRRHADEVIGAAEEGAEGGGEGLPAAGLHADRGGDHLLLGDVHLEEAVRVLGGEALGVGRVADLAVERDDLLVDRADPGEGVAVGAAGRDLLAELVGWAARPLPRAISNGFGAGGDCTVTLSERIPPSSSTAASGSASGLPCWFSLSSTAATPEPFFVRAKITAGRSASERRA